MSHCGMGDGSAAEGQKREDQRDRGPELDAIPSAALTFCSSDPLEEAAGEAYRQASSLTGRDIDRTAGLRARTDGVVILPQTAASSQEMRHEEAHESVGCGSGGCGRFVGTCPERARAGRGG